MSRRIVLSVFAVALLIAASQVQSARAGLFTRWWQPSQLGTRDLPRTSCSVRSTVDHRVRSVPYRRVPSRSWSTLPQKASDYGQWPPYYR